MTHDKNLHIAPLLLTRSIALLPVKRDHAGKKNGMAGHFA
ncbi:Hypothetical protein ABZS17G119_01292 [Kosakonia cowanii]